MPLVGTNNVPVLRLEYVHFRMSDGATNVPCAVTREALEDRCEDAGPRTTFSRHRAEIELIASRKYDEGDVLKSQIGELLPGSVVVETRDMNP
jgi:hypothetical protein